MNEYVALLRGINVGKTNRVAMADLRALLTRLGYTDVRTLLNSGNAVFRAPDENASELAQKIQREVSDRLGLEVPVIVVSARDISAIVANNPLPHACIEASKFLVGVVQREESLAPAVKLSADSWEPEALALRGTAAYLWCANGIRESKVAKAFSRATGEQATTRNWATWLKLQAVLGAGKGTA